MSFISNSSDSSASASYTCSPNGTLELSFSYCQEQFGLGDGGE